MHKPRQARILAGLRTQFLSLPPVFRALPLPSPDSIAAYDYHLPAELIAQHPLARRSDARLMLVDRRRDTIDHYHVRDLPQLLARGDCLVLNNTRVVPR